MEMSTRLDDEHLQEIINLYKKVLREVICRAHNEDALFPIRLTITNPDESWSAEVDLVDQMFSARHGAGEVKMKFPLRIEAVDARNDQVASAILAVQDTANLDTTLR
jgi:hypothetical protein